jgi:hypothetical protein
MVHMRERSMRSSPLHTSSVVCFAFVLIRAGGIKCCMHSRSDLETLSSITMQFGGATLLSSPSGSMQKNLIRAASCVPRGMDGLVDFHISACLLFISIFTPIRAFYYIFFLQVQKA